MRGRKLILGMIFCGMLLICGCQQKKQEQKGELVYQEMVGSSSFFMLNLY